MELQFAYEAIRRHFAGYGDEPAAAYEGGACRYRTSDGRCCAIGCLIPPALYDESLDLNEDPENFSGGSIMGVWQKADFDKNPVAGAVVQLLGINDENVRNWSEFQIAHDDTAIQAQKEGRTATGNEVVTALDRAAEKLGLETPYTLRAKALAEADEQVQQRFGTAA